MRLYICDHICHLWIFGRISFCIGYSINQLYSDLASRGDCYFTNIGKLGSCLGQRNHNAVFVWNFKRKGFMGMAVNGNINTICIGNDLFGRPIICGSLISQMPYKNNIICAFSSGRIYSLLNLLVQGVSCGIITKTVDVSS